ncbi:hypothetical protein Tco_0806725 [Tanacetum coccineum]
MMEDVENENSNISSSDEPVLLNTPLSVKVECSDPEVDIDEIDAFLAMGVSSNFDEGYYDSEGDVIFWKVCLVMIPPIISLPKNDPLHHEFAGEIITLPSRIVREHEEYLSLMTLLCEISTSQSPKNVHVNPSSIIASHIPVEDSDSVQEEIDIFLVPGDLIPPGVENDDFEDEDNSTFLPDHELPNFDHQDNPSAPRPPPKPPDVCLNFKPDTAMKNEDFNQGEIVLFLNVEDVNPFTFVIWTFLPFFIYPEDSPIILSFSSTDIAKISRKRSKPDKHGHGNGIECARAGRMLSKLRQRARYVNVNDIAKERILQKFWNNKLGGQIREKTLTEEQEDPEKYGETKIERGGWAINSGHELGDKEIQKELEFLVRLPDN